MFVDAELNFSFFVLLGNDEFAVTVREGIDTVIDNFDCVLFEVLKRLEEEGGGGAYGYRLCDTPNEAKVPS